MKSATLYIGCILGLATVNCNAAIPAWYEHPANWLNNVFNAPQHSTQAPEITAVDIGGNSRLLADETDDYILLSFWASWCPPCRKELPQLEALATRHLTHSFKILAINVHDEKSEALTFLSNYPNTLNILFDVNDKTAASYAISPIPVNVLIQRSTMTIEKTWHGDGSVEKIDAYLSMLSKSKNQTP